MSRLGRYGTRGLDARVFHLEDHLEHDWREEEDRRNAPNHKHLDIETDGDIGNEREDRNVKRGCKEREREWDLDGRRLWRSKSQRENDPRVKKEPFNPEEAREMTKKSKR